jgi:hypothetical protein
VEIEVLVDVFDISVFAETHSKYAAERVEEKVKKLVLVDLTVYLLVFGHISASRPLN